MNFDELNINYELILSKMSKKFPQNKCAPLINLSVWHVGMHNDLAVYIH